MAADAGHGKRLRSETHWCGRVNPSLNLTYAAVIWGKIEKKTAEAELEKMRRQMLGETTEAAGSNLTGALEAFLVI